MANTQPTLNSLAAQITQLSQTLTNYLAENNVPVPTFAADSPTSYTNLSPEIFMTRQVLMDALMDLLYLTQGPSESIFNYVHCAIPDATALNVMNYFNFWSAVPLEGSASYADIAKHTSLPQEVVTRIIQHAVTLRIFAETEPGSSTTRIQHTSRSAALLHSSGLRALVSTVLDDAGAPLMFLHEALQRYSRGKPALTKDMNETSFALLHSGGTFGGKHSNSWEFIENDGEGDKQGWRQANFVEFMRYIKEIFQLEKVMLSSYDWASAGKATVVDLGGSGGHDSVVLAENFPDLTITVQDLPKVKPVFEANVPTDLKSRISFVEHDIFQPQPVQADIYIIKLILHDWPEDECIKILRALVPSLKAGARVLFIDYIGKPGNSDGPLLPRSFQHYGTSTDLRMMALFNAKERPIEDYQGFFRSADERFDIVRVEANPETFIAIIEVVWLG